MYEELLRIADLPKLAELRFLLLEALGDGKTVTWYDLLDTCRSYSYELGFTFENGVNLLKEIGLVEMDEDKSVRSNLGLRDRLELKEDDVFCRWVTTILVRQLEKAGLLSTFFNSDTVKFDLKPYSISINVNLIPLDYPMMKVYLQKMEIADPDWNINSRIIINYTYRKFFIEEVLSRALKGSTTLDVIMSEGGRMTSAMTPLQRAEAATSGVRVFISYSNKDGHFKEELRKHFSGLVQAKLIEIWHDGMIQPGDEWDANIKRHLEEANIVIFLVSADFMDSGYINRVELQRAMERHEQGQIRIVPILIRPCDHASLSLSKFQMLPRGAVPVALYENQDQAYTDIVDQFKEIVGKRS
jgi:TIR domain